MREGVRAFDREMAADHQNWRRGGQYGDSAIVFASDHGEMLVSTKPGVTSVTCHPEAIHPPGSGSRNREGSPNDRRFDRESATPPQRNSGRPGLDLSRRPPGQLVAVAFPFFRSTFPRHPWDRVKLLSRTTAGTQLFRRPGRSEREEKNLAKTRRRKVAVRGLWDAPTQWRVVGQTLTRPSPRKRRKEAPQGARCRPPRLRRRDDPEARRRQHRLPEVTGIWRYDRGARYLAMNVLRLHPANGDPPISIIEHARVLVGRDPGWTSISRDASVSAVTREITLRGEEWVIVDQRAAMVFISTAAARRSGAAPGQQLQIKRQVPGGDRSRR